MEKIEKYTLKDFKEELLNTKSKNIYQLLAKTAFLGVIEVLIKEKQEDEICQIED